MYICSFTNTNEIISTGTGIEYLGGAFRSLILFLTLFRPLLWSAFHHDVGAKNFNLAEKSETVEFVSISYQHSILQLQIN